MYLCKSHRSCCANWEIFTLSKIVRIIQPNNSVTEYSINKKIYDDHTGEINVLNDISRGAYDVVVVTGSTLPTNRYAQLEMYMDAYKNGIIDNVEVLKKTEVFDMEGVMQRKDLTAQLQSQLQQSQEEIKKLQGDMQTREREVYHAKQRAEIEKFKADLDKQSTQSKMSGKLFESRLDDVMGNVKSEIRESNKQKKQ